MVTYTKALFPETSVGFSLKVSLLHFFYSIACVLFLVTTQSSVSAQSEPFTRVHESIDMTWKFQLGDNNEARLPGFDDNQWRTLNLPHDWSIEGTYDKSNPSGIAGGFLPTGTGWYRKHLDWDPAWAGKRVSLQFDGIYMNSEVWVNGISVGIRPYGYISFKYDITDHLTEGSNVIAIRVDNNKAPSGRWYTGSGIYRHVWLTVTDKQHIPYNGVFVRSENVTTSKAELRVSTELKNSAAVGQTLQLTSRLVDQEGRTVIREQSVINVAPGKTELVK